MSPSSGPEVAEQKPALSAKVPKLGWGEKRDRRRRNRKTFEEVLGWILVPALLYMGYVIFEAVGGIPKEAKDIASEIYTTIISGRF